MIITFTKQDARHGDVAFVLSAVSKDKKRQNLMLVQSDGGQLIATDGHRMHKAAVPYVPDGLYKPVVSRSEITLVPDTNGHTFPRWQSVWPQDKVEKLRLSISKHSSHDDMFCHVIRATGSAFKYNQVVDIFENMVGRDVLVCQSRPDGTALFENCTRAAIVMPMRTQ